MQKRGIGRERLVHGRRVALGTTDWCHLEAEEPEAGILNRLCDGARRRARAGAEGLFVRRALVLSCSALCDQGSLRGWRGDGTRGRRRRPLLGAPPYHLLAPLHAGHLVGSQLVREGIDFNVPPLDQDIVPLEHDVLSCLLFLRGFAIDGGRPPYICRAHAGRHNAVARWPGRQMWLIVWCRNGMLRRRALNS